MTKVDKNFDQSYLNLHPYVYRQGPESDIYVLKPGEYHASNSELIRILQRRASRGTAARRRQMRTLYTWIDLNAPYFGAFTQIDLKPQSPKNQVQRPHGDCQEIQRHLRRLATGDQGLRRMAEAASERRHRRLPRPAPASPHQAAEGERLSPSPPSVATAKQADTKGRRPGRLPLLPASTLELVWIPAGRFVMGDNPHARPLRPPSRPT